MKTENIKRLLILLMSIWFVVLLLAGCSSTKVKCVKSHEEKETCFRYTYVYHNGNTVPRLQYYPCTKTVCDQYEKVEE